MSVLQDKIINAIELIIDEKLNKLEFNRVLEGKITEVLTAPNYKIICHGDEYKAKAINDATYLVDDRVYVLVLNNNFSNKIILCKIP